MSVYNPRGGWVEGDSVVVSVTTRNCRLSHDPPLNSTFSAKHRSRCARSDWTSKTGSTGNVNKPTCCLLVLKMAGGKGKVERDRLLKYEYGLAILVLVFAIEVT